MPKAIEFFEKHQNNIVLLIGVILISLFSFAMGYIIARHQEKTPIKIEQNIIYEDSYYWGRDLRALFILETIGKRV